MLGRQNPVSHHLRDLGESLVLMNQPLKTGNNRNKMIIQNVTYSNNSSCTAGLFQGDLGQLPNKLSDFPIVTLAILVQCDELN